MHGSHKEIVRGNECCNSGLAAIHISVSYLFQMKKFITKKSAQNRSTMDCTDFLYAFRLETSISHL